MNFPSIPKHFLFGFRNSKLVHWKLRSIEIESYVGDRLRAAYGIRRRGNGSNGGGGRIRRDYTNVKCGAKRAILCKYLYVARIDWWEKRIWEGYQRGLNNVCFHSEFVTLRLMVFFVYEILNTYNLYEIQIITLAFSNLDRLSIFVAVVCTHNSKLQT